VSTEGTIPYAGGETWHRIAGDGEEPGKLPLLCLHGGPGALHDYLEPLDELAATGRRVVFYDQIGCGRSWTESKPADFWTVDLFVREVQAVRDALGLDRIHLFGSSWGGMLAMEYALTKPSGLASLVLSSSPASIPVWEAETGRLRSELPADVRAVLDEHEAAGTADSPEYQAAQTVFYERHVCRVPYPDCVLRSFAGLAEHPDVYMTMQGPNEFVITGTLKHWDISDRLDEIEVPTLITAGEHDEFTPVQAEALHAGIPGSELVTFENASHMQFVEEPERYCQLVAEFLDRVERE
jgi:L-proline amide hydrolase